MRALTIVSLAVFGVLIQPTPVDAQAPETDGIWYGFGVGYGFTMLNCGICSSRIHTGPAVQLRAGSKLSPSLLFGVEGSGWMKRVEDVDQFVISLHAMAYLYGAAVPGVFLKGGIGPVWFGANERGGDDDLSSLGISLLIGAGYEARLSDHTSLTPYVSIVGSGYGKLRFEDGVASNQFGVAQAQLGLSLTTY